MKIYTDEELENALMAFENGSHIWEGFTIDFIDEEEFIANYKHYHGDDYDFNSNDVSSCTIFSATSGNPNLTFSVLSDKVRIEIPDFLNSDKKEKVVTHDEYLEMFPHMKKDGTFFCLES